MLTNCAQSKRLCVCSVSTIKHLKITRKEEKNVVLLMTDPKLPEEFCLWSTYTKIIMKHRRPTTLTYLKPHGPLFDKDRDTSKSAQVMTLYRCNNYNILQESATKNQVARHYYQKHALWKYRCGVGTHLPKQRYWQEKSFHKCSKW